MTKNHPGAQVCLFSLIFLLCGTAQAAEPESPPKVSVSAAAMKELQELAIQHNGRVKPFDSFAWETVDRLTGSARFRDEDPVNTILSIVAHPDAWQEVPLLSVPFGPLREALGLGRRTTHVSYNELISTRKLMRMLPPIVEKQQRSEKLTMLENETMELFDRFVIFTSLIKQELHLVPPSKSGQAWLPILPAEEWVGLISALREGNASSAQRAHELVQRLQATNPSLYPARWRLRLEVIYNHLGPFRIARLFYLLAAVLLLLFAVNVQWVRLPGIGIGLYGAALLIHATGILTRVVLGGRPPVSNFYETMLWLPFVGAVLALVFERIYRSGFFGFSGGILAAIVLLLADHLPLDPSISPVVAVLRSNLWLTIHVLTVVGSYAPIALATVLAHLYGWFFLAGGEQHPALPSLSRYLYRSIQVGVVLLSAGIMLGAVWANASWGRYWGWDPKETWALITLLWYLSVLHGRFAGWLKGVWMALCTIAGFFLLLMTYYGVSFYLVGLHSYAGGSAKPMPPLLIAYLLAEAAFIAWVALRAVNLRRQPV